MPHKDKEQHRLYKREWQRRNPDKVKRAKFKYQYGLSMKRFESLLNSQNGKCAICEASGVLNVDHDHRNGNVRGLLCAKCNVGIGHFDDSPSRLLKASEYLNKS